MFPAFVGSMYRSHFPTHILTLGEIFCAVPEAGDYVIVFIEAIPAPGYKYTTKLLYFLMGEVAPPSTSKAKAPESHHSTADDIPEVYVFTFI